jgi:hypothetical protein
MLRLVVTIRYRLAAPHRAWQRLTARPLTDVLLLIAAWAACFCVASTTAADMAAHLSPAKTLLWIAAECLVVAVIAGMLGAWLAQTSED